MMMPVLQRNILEKHDTHRQTNTSVSYRRNGEKGEGYILQKQIRRGQVQSFGMASANLDSSRCQKTTERNVNVDGCFVTTLAVIKGL